MFPVALDLFHDELKFRVSTQLVPVLVTLKPGIVVVSALDSLSQPRQGWFLLAQQRINGTDPFRQIAVHHFFGLITKDARVNLVAFAARSMYHGGKDHGLLFRMRAAELQ